MPEQVSLSTPLAYALAYASIGWHVLPLQPRTKHPLGKLVPRGMLDASTDPEVISGWWARCTDAGIGIAMAQSGLVTIDIDPRNGGTDTFEQLQAAHGSLRSEVMAFTGGGGEHYVFVVPGGHQVSLPGTLGPGVDLKANGYIVVEPSIHPSGKTYGWEGSSSPLDGVVPSPLPDWLRSLRIDLQRPAPMAGDVPVDARQARDVREALYLLDCDDHDTWVQAGMALHSTGWGHPAYAMWCAWSQQSPKFDSTDQRNRWQSFHTDGVRSLRLSFIFAKAQALGWVNPAARLSVVSAIESGYSDVSPLDLASMAENPAEPIRFIVDKWLPARAVTVLTAHGGVGKSTMSLQLAVCLALGMPWFGIKTQEVKVLLVSCEDAQQAIHWRLSHVCTYLGVSMAALQGLVTIYDMTERDCVLWAKGGATERMQWLHGVCVSSGAGAVIIDNASDAFADNENDRSAVRGFVRTLAKIAIQIDGAVLLLAHVDKASARGVIESTDNYSGSTAWNNSARSRWAMVRNKDKTIEISNEKNNYAARQDPFRVEYDPLQHAFVSGQAPVSGAVADMLRNSSRLRIMEAVSAANGMGDRLGTKRTSPNNAFSVLKKSYKLPQDIIPEDFWDYLNVMIDWGYIIVQDYIQTNRTPGKHYVLTDAGKGKVTAKSGAAPMWKGASE